MDVSDIFYFFLLGEGRGSPRCQTGGLAGFFTENPRRGGGLGVCLWRIREFGGVGAKYFFSVPKRPPSMFRMSPRQAKPKRGPKWKVHAFDSVDRKRGQRKGATSKTSKSVKNIFDTFRHFSRRAKNVKNRQKVSKYFRHFSPIFARHQFSGPSWGSLIYPFFVNSGVVPWENKHNSHRVNSGVLPWENKHNSHRILVQICPRKSSWTDLSLVWFAGMTPDMCFLPFLLPSFLGARVLQVVVHWNREMQNLGWPLIVAPRAPLGVSRTSGAIAAQELVLLKATFTDVCFVSSPSLISGKKKAHKLLTYTLIFLSLMFRQNTENKGKPHQTPRICYLSEP